MDKATVQHIIAFMQRVEIKGAEALLFASCMAELQQMLEGPKQEEPECEHDVEPEQTKVYTKGRASCVRSIDLGNT